MRRTQVNAPTSRTKFKVFGPFVIPLSAGRRGISVVRDSKTAQQMVLAQIERLYKGDNLRTKKGCYVFALRTAGRGQRGGALKPWYVGKAHKTSLLRESLSSRNLGIYGKVLDRTIRCTPLLYWIAKAAPGQKNAANAQQIKHMEEALIWHAVDRNEHLENIQRNPKRFSFEIQGVPLVGQHQVALATRGAARDMVRMLDLM